MVKPTVWRVVSLMRREDEISSWINEPVLHCTTFFSIVYSADVNLTVNTFPILRGQLFFFFWQRFSFSGQKPPRRMNQSVLHF